MPPLSGTFNTILVSGRKQEYFTASPTKDEIAIVQNIKGRTCDLLPENWTMKYVRVLPSRGGGP
jgi:hypothetical protein